MDRTKYYISMYSNVRKDLLRFKELSPDQKYNEFVPMAVNMVSHGCKGIISDMVKALTEQQELFDITKLNRLYTIAVFMNPFSIQEIAPQHITEAIAEEATKSNNWLLRFVPKNVYTDKMYAREYLYENLLSDSYINIVNTITTTDFEQLLKTIGAKNSFGVELEFIADCRPELVLNYINTVLKLCYPHVITSNQWFRMVKDCSAPHMYEIKTAPILHRKELTTLYCIIMCLDSLVNFGVVTINNSCGVHIHINAEDWDYQTVEAIERVYLNNMTPINRLMAPNRLFNPYCIPSPCTKRLDEVVLMSMSEKELRKHKYHVVNTLSWFYFKSIEFRQYEGTTSTISLMSWIEFLHKFVQNYENIGNCISADNLFKRIGLSASASTYFKNKYMNRRLF